MRPLIISLAVGAFSASVCIAPQKIGLFSLVPFKVLLIFPSLIIIEPFLTFFGMGLSVSLETKLVSMVSVIFNSIIAYFIASKYEGKSNLR